MVSSVAMIIHHLSGACEQAGRRRLPKRCPCIFNLAKGGVVARYRCTCRGLRDEVVVCTCLVNACFLIDLHPRAMRQGDNAWAHACGNGCGAHAFAYRARKEHRISIGNAGRCCVFARNENRIGPCFAQPRYVVECGVCAAQVMRIDYLQRIFAGGFAAPIGEAAFVAVLQRGYR